MFLKKSTFRVFAFQLPGFFEKKGGCQKLTFLSFLRVENVDMCHTKKVKIGVRTFKLCPKFVKKRPPLRGGRDA